MPKECIDSGAFPCCATPEDPGLEVRTEVPSYAGMPVASPPPYSGGSSAQGNSSPFAPPMQQGGDPYAPVMVPNPVSPSNGGGGGGGYGGGGAGLSADAILSDLDGAEMKAYQDAYVSFGGGSPVPLDNAQMRDFLQQNAAIEDIDVVLLQAMNDNMQVEMGAFISVLQTNAMGDGDAIGQFSSLSTDGEQLAAEECRTGLTMMGMDRFAVNYNDDRWDGILNMVMMDAGPTVNLEQWIRYCKTVARYIRLFKYCGV